MGFWSGLGIGLFFGMGLGGGVIMLLIALGRVPPRRRDHRL